MRLSNIRIILVEPTHPGNIGAIARAMKNMGLEQLYLVKPQHFPDREAVVRAARADDILDAARVVDSVDEAIENCTLVCGTSARLRIFQQTLVNPREMVEKIAKESAGSEIAVIFGPEASGLSNEILEKCHLHVYIPSNPHYSSLNLAMAVQVIAYELRMGLLAEQKTKALMEEPLATADELEGFYQHLESTMIAIRFLNPKSPRRMRARFRRLFARARIDKNDLNMLRGMVSAICTFIKNNEIK